LVSGNDHISPLLYYLKIKKKPDRSQGKWGDAAVCRFKDLIEAGIKPGKVMGIILNEGNNGAYRLSPVSVIQ
jgi:hypothetical protein